MGILSKDQLKLVKEKDRVFCFCNYEPSINGWRMVTDVDENYIFIDSDIFSKETGKSIGGHFSTSLISLKPYKEKRSFLSRIFKTKPLT